MSPAVIKLAPVMLPVADTTPMLRKLPACTLPTTEKKLVALLKVIPATAFAAPSSLKTTCVLLPATVRLPLILPVTLPKKFWALILPEQLRSVSVPTLVMDGCAAVERVPARVVALITEPLIVPVAETAAALTALITVRLVSVPT